jgi:hypothetical protein
MDVALLGRRPLLPVPVARMWTSAHPASPYPLPFRLVLSFPLYVANRKADAGDLFRRSCGFPLLRVISRKEPRCRPLLPPQRNKHQGHHLRQLWPRAPLEGIAWPPLSFCYYA